MRLALGNPLFQDSIVVEHTARKTFPFWKTTSKMSFFSPVKRYWSAPRAKLWPLKGSRYRNGLDWTGLDWTGLDWTGLDCLGTGLDQIFGRDLNRLVSFPTGRFCGTRTLCNTLFLKVPGSCTGVEPNQVRGIEFRSHSLFLEWFLHRRM